MIARIVLIAVYVACVTANTEILPRIILKNNNETSYKCIVNIYHRLFKTTAILIRTNDEESDDRFTERMIHALAETQIPLILANDEILHRKGSEKKFWDALVLIQAQNCKLLEHVGKRIIKHGLKYLLLVKGSCLEELNDVGALVSEYDVTFLTTPDDKLVNFHPRMQPQTCQRRAVTKNLTCSSVKTTSDIFPRKVIKNFERCPLTVGFLSTGTYSFFADYQNVKPLSPLLRNYNVSGSDVDAFDMIATRVNATILLVSAPFSPLCEHMIENGTLNAVGGRGLIDTHSYDHVGYTQSYSIERFFWTYYVERSPRSLGSLFKRSEGIVFFIILFLCFSFGWYVVRYFDNSAVSVATVLLESWGALFGATWMQSSQSLKQKVLNITYSILCVHFSAYIGSQLYSLLVIDKPPRSYNNLEELLESGMTFYISRTPAFFDLLNVTQRAVYCDNYDPVDCQLLAIENKGIALGSSFLWFSRVQLQTAVNDEARMVRIPETIVYSYVQALTAKYGSTSVLIKNYISQLFESGVMNRLRKFATGPEVDGARRVAEKIMSNDYSCQSGCSMRLTDVVMIFYVLLGGYALASSVFMFELLRGKWKNRRVLKKSSKNVTRAAKATGHWMEN